MRDLYWTFRNFRNRVADFLRYRRVTANMDERFPDATAPQLERGDHTCIVCREDMVEGGRNKVLPCGHVFHLHCLRCAAGAGRGAGAGAAASLRGSRGGQGEGGREGGPRHSACLCCCTTAAMHVTESQVVLDDHLFSHTSPGSSDCSSSFVLYFVLARRWIVSLRCESDQLVFSPVQLTIAAKLLMLCLTLSRSTASPRGIQELRLCEGEMTSVSPQSAVRG